PGSEPMRWRRDSLRRGAAKQCWPQCLLIQCVVRCASWIYTFRISVTDLLGIGSLIHTGRVTEPPALASLSAVPVTRETLNFILLLVKGRAAEGGGGCSHVPFNKATYSPKPVEAPDASGIVRSGRWPGPALKIGNRHAPPRAQSGA